MERYQRHKAGGMVIAQTFILFFLQYFEAEA
jgi:hypothetical protein